MHYRQKKNPESVSLPSVNKEYVPEITQETKIAEQKENVPQDNLLALPKKPTPRSISLNNLAQGFQAYANHKKKQMTQEQTLEITEIRFLEKLIQAVFAQLKINRHQLASYATQTYALHCAVSIAKDGLVKQIAISKTSGNIFLDSLIKKIIQDASGAFPPIPQSIKKVPYMLIFDLKLGSYVSLQVLLPK